MVVELFSLESAAECISNGGGFLSTLLFVKRFELWLFTADLRSWLLESFMTTTPLTQSKSWNQKRSAVPKADPSEDPKKIKLSINVTKIKTSKQRNRERKDRWKLQVISADQFQHKKYIASYQKHYSFKFRIVFFL